MREAAADERFEDAARYRNRLFAIENLAEKQGADRRETGSIDVLGVAAEGDRAAVQVFPLRGGKMIDRHGFHLENVEGQDVTTVLEAFALEYYGNAPSIPPQIVVPPDATGLEALQEFLSELRGSRVEVRAPARGEKRRLAELAAQNARLALDSEPLVSEQKQLRRVARARGAARGAQPREPAAPDRVLRHLEHPGPGDRRLDGGLPGRDRRRRRTTASSRSAASTARTTSRRWPRSSRAASPGCATGTEDEYDEGFATAPNLVVIDGGKGQLSAALAAMQAYELPRVAVISLAKRVEEVFVPGRPTRSCSTRTAPVLQLLQRVRDEAHRFALGFHRQRRSGAVARVALRHARGRRPGAAAGAPPALRLDRGRARGDAGGARGRSRRPGEDGARDLRAAAQDRRRLGAPARRLRRRSKVAARLAPCGRGGLPRRSPACAEREEERA